jgi:hypothetical protein
VAVAHAQAVELLLHGSHFLALGTLAQYTAVATAYNNALYGGLTQAGIEFIPLDTFTILREIVASPTTYGFRNVTDSIDYTANNVFNEICYCTHYSAPFAFLGAEGKVPPWALFGVPKFIVTL